MKAHPVLVLSLSSLASARCIEWEPQPRITLSQVPISLSPTPRQLNTELRAPDDALPTAFATESDAQAPTTQAVSAEPSSVGEPSVEGQEGAAPPPPYTAIVTPAPDQSAILASEGYQQSTYYTCLTIHAQSHCGYHIPLYKSEGSSSSGARTGGPVASLWKQAKSWLGDGRKMDAGIVFVAVMGLTGVFVVGLM